MPDPNAPVAIPRPIEDHGIIGDMATAALVAVDGTVDFLCWPRMDGPSVFVGLLDSERGGDFTVRPELPDARTSQCYLPDTNVLVTRWLSPNGSAEVVDLMPVIEEPGPRLVRQVRATRGRVRFRIRCRPWFDYARVMAEAKPCDGGVRFEPAGGPQLRLSATIAITSAGHDATADFELDAGQCASFVLDGGEGQAPAADVVQGWVDQTIDFWRDWIGRSSYRGRWREAVDRSALVMKLLTNREHHSIVAAATFGLPEAPGGPRNWDYRATWIRDASFTVYAFLRLGYQAEAVDFMGWVAQRISEAADDSGRMQIMYGIDGTRDLPEQSLDHLAGYGGARPVRIGNDAHRQVQLDIYGELLDSGYLVNKYAQAISHDGWGRVVRAVGYVCQNWEQPDAGIWEVRGEPQHYLHSRAIRLAFKRSLPAPVDEWTAARARVHADVWDHFWDDRGNHFARTRGGSALDGSMLMLPLVRFCSATDPRWLLTLDAIGRELVDDGLVYRYLGDDGLAGAEGAFLPCSFWYAECLARAGRLWEARTAFERALGHANHLGLFSEEIGRSGEFLGNFPQALTHLTLISTAYYLDRELSGSHPGIWRP
jgi:GH15 family glucan-1,4-alpha-glucosidase